ncbi:hypothetical protein AKJ64_02530 [candidate division MSBL1 archaeon SCGC-AAA259E17]|uniref:Uncharacterized protein n=1 Tax=candidate division MSBL1 archaeon SCGC-AAA259E17 TaxID=1698263 RepID=A0A133UEP4_9EURY|nr:hypothetical protein AKJ64_02530 [candidate division MSBL1 archaeon SCGC-AAA259E17]
MFKFSLVVGLRTTLVLSAIRLATLARAESLSRMGEYLSRNEGREYHYDDGDLHGGPFGHLEGR